MAEAPGASPGGHPRRGESGVPRPPSWPRPTGRPAATMSARRCPDDLAYQPVASDPQFGVVRLAVTEVMAVLLGSPPDGLPELRRAVPPRCLPCDRAVIAQRSERDQAGAAGTAERLAQPVVGRLRLVVSVGADQPVKDLPGGQRELVAVFGENSADGVEQAERVAARPPRGKAARPGHGVGPAGDGAHQPPAPVLLRAAAPASCARVISPATTAHVSGPHPASHTRMRWS